MAGVYRLYSFSQCRNNTATILKKICENKPAKLQVLSPRSTGKEVHLLDVLPDGQGGDILLLEGWLNRLWIPMSVQYLSKVNPIKTSQ